MSATPTLSDEEKLPQSGLAVQASVAKPLIAAGAELEERVLRHIEALEQTDGIERRMTALARARVQEAFMWLQRAIHPPMRVPLPEDFPAKEPEIS